MIVSVIKEISKEVNIIFAFYLFVFFIVPHPFWEMDKCNKELQLKNALEENIVLNIFHNYLHLEKNLKLYIFLRKNLDFNVFCPRVQGLAVYVGILFSFLLEIYFYIWNKYISVFEENLDLDIFAVTRPRGCIRRGKSVKLETGTKTLRDLTDAFKFHYFEFFKFHFFGFFKFHFFEFFKFQFFGDENLFPSLMCWWVLSFLPHGTVCYKSGNIFARKGGNIFVYPKTILTSPFAIPPQPFPP